MVNRSKIKGTDERWKFQKLPLRDRLYLRTNRAGNGCLEFTGYVDDQTGYGQISVQGRKENTHKAAWELENGAVQGGLFVLHTCDNRRCVDVSHLFLGTPDDNMKDAKAKGRNGAAYNLASPYCKLSLEEVASIKERYVRNYERYIRGWRSNAKELAEEFGITTQYVADIARGKWRKRG